jgi:hypothetical protein
VWLNLNERLLDRSAHRSENNIRMNLKEIGYESMDYSCAPQDRYQWYDLVNMLREGEELLDLRSD